MKKMIFLFLLITVFMAYPSSSACAEGADNNPAEKIGRRLIVLFSPESITVKINNKDKLAWVDATGARFDKVRVEKLTLLASLNDIPEKFDSDDKKALASLISSSKGEVVLLEKDVNSYFADASDVSGFSKLNFSFSPSGYTADGLFSADFLFGLTIKLNAQGTLGLRKDGVYLENTVISAGGHRQPDGLSSLIVNKINPLLSFSNNPFPIEFTEIKMTDKAAVMTARPAPFTSGVLWKWKK